MFNVMPDILGGNRIYDVNNFRNNGEINDRNYNAENHGNQLPESTLYRVDHNGNYEAVTNTGSTTTIVQPKILKKPRKQNNNNPKTIRIYKNKKETNNNILSSTNEENEKNVQNNNLNNNLNQSRGDKSEINAMDALFWALDQQENIKLKQLEKEKDKDKDKDKEINNEKNNICDNNDVNINEKLEYNTKEKERNDDNVNNNSNNIIETNEKSDNNNKIEISSENKKIKENGDEEEKVGYEIEKNKTNGGSIDDDEMDIESK